jgi:hypothetical protein
MLLVGTNRMPRFTLYSLDDGDEYVGDVAVTYFASMARSSPQIEPAASPFLQGYGKALGAPVSGRLRLAGRSLFFDPDDDTLPVLSMKLRDVTLKRHGSHHSSGGGDDSPVDGQLSTAQPIVIVSTAVRLQLASGKHHVHVADNKVAATVEHRFEGTGSGGIPRSFVGRVSLLVEANSSVADPQARSDAVHAIQEATEAQVPFSLSWLSSALEKVQLQLPCHRITPLCQERGRLVLTTRALYFQPTFALGAQAAESFPIATIQRVANRRVDFVDKAVEFAVKVGTSGKHARDAIASADASALFHLVLFRFRSAADRNKLVSGLKKAAEALKPRPDTLLANFGDNLSKRVAAFCRAWVRGRVSNFDYLMFLNWAAGRTLSDVAQYPVIPWVIADYTSPQLDLNNPAVFRDLSKPVGALNAQRLAGFRARAKELELMGEEPYLYGSHYSNPAYVTYWLLRERPEFMLVLHGGKFDHASRIFDSVPASYDSVTTGPTDLKELIPQFFFGAGQHLTTHGSTLAFRDIGVKGDGAPPAEHVVLPPWASSPADFVAKNRQALECEYVSRHLHEWIDLIFGACQTGERAWARDNVFHPMSYETARSAMDRLTDPAERAALATHVREFGQVPLQLFDAPHPQRECGATPASVINTLYFMPDEDAVSGQGNPLEDDEIPLVLSATLGGTDTASSFASQPMSALVPPRPPSEASNSSFGVERDSGLDTPVSPPISRVPSALDPFQGWLKGAGGEGAENPTWRPRMDPQRVGDSAIRAVAFVDAGPAPSPECDSPTKESGEPMVVAADTAGKVTCVHVSSLSLKPTPVVVPDGVGAVIALAAVKGARGVLTVVGRNGMVAGVEVDPVGSGGGGASAGGTPAVEVTTSVLRACAAVGTDAAPCLLVGGRDGGLKLVALNPQTGSVLPPQKKKFFGSEPPQTSWDLESSIVAACTSPCGRVAVALNEEGCLFGLGALDALQSPSDGNGNGGGGQLPRFAGTQSMETAELPEDAGKGPEDVAGMWFVAPAVIAIVSYSGRLTRVSVAYDNFGELLGGSSIAATIGGGRVTCVSPLQCSEPFPTIFVIGSRGGFVAFVDAKTGKPRGGFAGALPGEQDPTAIAVQGRRVVIGDAGGSVHVIVATFT